MEILEEYRSWVEKEIPITDEWDEEVNYIIYLRSQIAENQASLNKKQLDQIDAKWRNQIKETSDGTFKVSIERQDKPKEQWWWWIDKLGA